jgi:hypothetical protein
MIDRIRRFVESVVYAGLNPASGPRQSKGAGRFAPFRERLDKFISGGRPRDPLYLTNRTWSQKLRLAAVVATPCLIVAGIVGLLLNGVFRPKTAPPKELTAADMIAKVLPGVGETKIEKNADAEVAEVTVDRQGAGHVVGVLKNKTDHVISVDLVLAFVNGNGSRVDTNAFRVKNAPAGSLFPFSFPLRTPDAVHVFVMEIRTVK